ncbi:MAG: HD domain-containing protein, partial [Candidatus Nomurabacteria bacterium]|nr:HD domain-containing protein [Candidatus Nomurabacteria bacterium]
RYNADKEIAELGAYLHDIALVENVGTRDEHNVRGAEIAVSLLEGYDYPKDRIERVRLCVLHHRSSRNSTSIEETCVADADILAHFDNISMIFASAFVRNQLKLENKDQLIEHFEKDFNDLSDMTKKWYRSRYETIMGVLFPDYDINRS